MRKSLQFFLLLGIILSFNCLQAQFNPLFIPDTLQGPTYNLTLAPSTVQFLPGDSTDTYGINGPILGPTLIMRKGDTVQMNVINQLSDTTTMHWHGMHIAPSDDGGPHNKIAPNTTWSPNFTIMDEASTYWYHPHLHHHTAEQVYQGLAGVIITHDAHEDGLNLPKTYGVDDFPIIIQDKSFDANNQFIFEALADTVMINGTLNPFLSVPEQMVRFRLLNGSNQRVYNIGLPPNLPVFQIASDGGLLAAPIPLNGILLAPGERTDIIIDFAGFNGQNLQMPCNNSQSPPGTSGGPGGPGGGPNNPLDSADFFLMEFRVNPATPNAVTSLPAVLNTYVKPNPLNVARTRQKVMTVDTTGFPFYINSELFDMGHMNDTIILDDIEVWEISNLTNTAHPFHIHDIQFLVQDYNGGPPPPHLAGRKDVILMLPGDSISFITQFDDFADSTYPYMYHCHNLFHEDAGMMGQFVVYEAGWVSREKEIALSQGFRMFPNPAQNQVRVELSDLQMGRMESIKLVDLSGKVLKKQEFSPSTSAEMNLVGLKPGMYLLQVKLENGKQGTLRLLKR